MLTLVIALAEGTAADAVVRQFVAHAVSPAAPQAAYTFERAALSGTVSQLPIGVFDSGIGGLTVMEAILTLDAFDNETLRPTADGRPDFAGERFIYFGDQANMPYGNYAAAGREDYLRELILKDAAFLLGRRYFPAPAAQRPLLDKPPVKAIVIACNTATAYGLQDIRSAIDAWQLPVIVVGVVEAGAQGVMQQIARQGDQGQRTAGGTAAAPVVAVLATTGTCSSMAYPKAIGRAVGLAGKRAPQVIQQGSVGLAGAIEGDPAFAVDIASCVRSEVTTLVENYRHSGGREPISMVVLGCTHFPLVEDEIAAAFARLRALEEAGQRPYQSLIAERIRFIDPAELTAMALFRELAKARLRAQPDQPLVAGDDLFFLSAPNPTAADVRLAADGGLDSDYKYGRLPGQLAIEDTRVVPMTLERLPAPGLRLIRDRLPEVWQRLQ